MLYDSNLNKRLWLSTYQYFWKKPRFT